MIMRHSSGDMDTQAVRHESGIQILIWIYYYIDGKAMKLEEMTENGTITKKKQI